MSTDGGVKIHLITGFLGVGKTTAVSTLATRRPPDERWAVLVNDVGLTGIDGAVLRDQPALGGMAIETLPGGCICCTSQLPFQSAVSQLIRMVQPHRLLIEPTGMAETSHLLEALRSFELSDAIDLQPTVVLIDPRRACTEAMWTHPVFIDQVMSADVIVGNRMDQCTPEIITDFAAVIETRRPGLRAVHLTEHGQLDPEWLNITLGVTAELPSRQAVPREQSPPKELDGLPCADPDGVIRWERNDQAGWRAGWVFPDYERFERGALEQGLIALMQPNVILTQVPLRLKGIAACADGRFAFNASSTGVDWTQLEHEALCAIEIITEPQAEADCGVVEAVLISATLPRSR
jgi:G3E family GTPase